MTLQIDLARLCEALSQQALDASQLVTQAENPITLQANYTASILLYRLSSALAIAAQVQVQTQVELPSQPQEKPNE